MFRKVWTVAKLSLFGLFTVSVAALLFGPFIGTDVFDFIRASFITGSTDYYVASGYLVSFLAVRASYCVFFYNSAAMLSYYPSTFF